MYIYIDGVSEDYRKNWKSCYKDDILCIVCMELNLVVMGLYDGDVVIWLRDIG